MENRTAKKKLVWEKYSIQKEIWPKSGRYILTQSDDDSVVVYQAYNKGIGEYAQQNGKFSGYKAFSDTRMTWIKTNFLWMMYRCGWGLKDKNQVVVLAIWLKKDAFIRILEHAQHSGFKPDVYGSIEEYNAAITKAKTDEFGFVRLQWDPDHSPGGSPHPKRRAIQLGLKGVKSFISGEDILRIEDISSQVAQQYALVQAGNLDDLMTPSERVWNIEDEKLSKWLRIGDFADDSNEKNESEKDL